MRFAVIGDIHSNINALASVLEDIETRQVEFIVSTGDLVGYLPFPNEVVDLIREQKILAIQGNHDRNIALGQHVTQEDILKMSDRELISSASAAFTNMAVTDVNRQYLHDMPEKLAITAGAFKLLLIHGSPRRIDEYLYNDPELLGSIAQCVEEDIIISGHTHLPYHQVVCGKHFINSGSVGKPKHGNANATYIIVNIKGQEISVEITEVPYDVEKTAKAVEQSRFFDPKLADMLRKGY